MSIRPIIRQFILPVLVFILAAGISSFSFAQKISAGSGHSLLICSDGTVKAWGDNNSFQLGVDTAVTYSSNVPIVVNGLTGTVTAVSAGGYHSLALKNDGTVWAWGNNYYGQLGDNGSNINSYTPLKVNGLNGVVAISAGTFHSLALKSDGTVWAWGNNFFGQLGDSTTNNTNVKVMAKYLTNIKAISAGEGHSMALRGDSTVWTWGYNYNGQLGLGTTSDSLYACKIPGLSKVIAIDAGGYHSLAVKNNGTVWAWGNNGNGQLGDGTQTDKPVPIQVTGLTNIKTVSGGTDHNMALKNDSAVWQWGADLPRPQRTTSAGTNPVILGNLASKVQGLTGIFEVSAGNLHALAYKSNETAWAWGNNGGGQLGNGNYDDHTLPVQTNCICGNIFPTVVASADVTICPGFNKTLSGIASGGNGGPYSYQWSPSININCASCANAVVYPLSATTYSVTGFDWKMCSAVDSVKVNMLPAPATPSITPSQPFATICNGNPVSLTASNTAASYYWIPGGSTSSTIIANPTSNAYYKLVTTEAGPNGCTASDSIEVNYIKANLVIVHASCNFYDGAIYPYPTGGDGFYSYAWSVPGTPTYVTSLAPGTYSVTITDNQSCSVSESVTIIDAGPLTLPALSITDITCKDAANGTATANPTGGREPYYYSWSPVNEYSQTVTGLAPGIYTVTVTDASDASCLTNIVRVFAISEPDPLVSSIASSTTVSCTGGNNGSATVTVDGGTLPYTYLWMPGGKTTSAANNLTAGEYTVTVTDAHNCSAAPVIKYITEPPLALTASASSTNVLCNNACDGTATSTASGGTTPYSYTWTPGGFSTPSISGLCPATYSLTTRDANGCSVTNSVIITQPTALTTTLTKTDATCNATCTGTASVTAAGGSGSFTYLWLPSSDVTQTPSFLCAGTHTVLISDNNNCVKTHTISIGQPLAIPITTTTTPTTCGSMSGTASVSISGPGAIPPFSILWTTGSTGTTINGLAAGIYRANVTDGNGCFGFDDALVTSSNGPVITTNSITPVSCFGLSNGAINISVTGPSAPYTFFWSNGQTTEDASNLSYGPYEVSVTDATGCLEVKSIFVNQPAQLSWVSSVINSGCAATNGSASVVVNGGNSPYSYLWASGGTTAAKTGLGAGVYGITITDSKGCTASTLIAVQDSGGPVVFVDTIVAANCGSNGYVLLVPQDSSLIAGYNWTTGSTSQNLIGVNPGNYGVVITDIIGCKSALIAPVNPVLPPLKPICLVTVDTVTNENLIVWEKPVSTFIAGFNIYRESSQQGIYQKIAYSPYANESSYFDYVADPVKKWSRYKISMKDICGTEGPLSPDHKTMHVSIQSATANSTTLIWDAHVGYPFSYYNIVRKDSLLGVWTVIGATPANITTYTDFAFPNTGFPIYYHVHVDHPGGDCVANIKNPEPQATTVSSGKSNASDRLTNPPSSVSEISAENWIALYPNPNHGLFTIELKSNSTSVIKIFNVLGEEVKRINCGSNKNKVEVDMRKQARGIYYVQVSSDERMITKKIVIE